MKYLIVFAVVLAAFWIWRKNRPQNSSPSRPVKPPSKASPQGAAEPQIMIACATCGVHLPQADALVGRLGLYCCAAHKPDEKV